VRQKLEKGKPQPERAMAKVKAVAAVSSRWEHGTCSVEGGEKLTYTYNPREGKPETKSLNLAAVSGRPLALRCSEKRTVILWSTGLEITNGADGVYLGAGGDVSWVGSKAVFPALALNGMLEELGGGVRAVFARADAKFSSFDVYWHQGRDSFSTFTMDESLKGRTVRKAEVGRRGRCYTVAFPELRRSFYVLMLKNGNAGVEEALPGKPPAPECAEGK